LRPWAKTFRCPGLHRYRPYRRPTGERSKILQRNSRFFLDHLDYQVIAGLALAETHPGTSHSLDCIRIVGTLPNRLANLSQGNFFTTTDYQLVRVLHITIRKKRTSSACSFGTAILTRDVRSRDFAFLTLCTHPLQICFPARLIPMIASPLTGRGRSS